MCSLTELTEANFTEEVMFCLVLVLLYFWANAEYACKGVTKMLETIADEHEGHIKVCKINFDDEQAIHLFTRFDVKKIPTVLLLHHGNTITEWNSLGFINKIPREIKMYTI